MLNHGEARIDRSASRFQRKSRHEAPELLNSNGKGLQTDSNPRNGPRQAGTDLSRGNALSVPGAVSCDHEEEGRRNICEVEVRVRRATWSGACAVVWFIVIVVVSVVARWSD